MRRPDVNWIVETLEFPKPEVLKPKQASEQTTRRVTDHHLARRCDALQAGGEIGRLARNSAYCVTPAAVTFIPAAHWQWRSAGKSIPSSARPKLANGSPVTLSNSRDR